MNSLSLFAAGTTVNCTRQEMRKLGGSNEGSECWRSREAFGNNPTHQRSNIRRLPLKNKSVDGRLRGNVRSTPESGHWRCTNQCPLSASSGHRQPYSITYRRGQVLPGGMVRLSVCRLKARNGSSVSRRTCVRPLSAQFPPAQKRRCLQPLISQRPFARDASRE